MNNDQLTTTSCPSCRNNRNRWDTPDWAPGPNPGPNNRPEPWGPAYPGPFGPGYWGGPRPTLEPWPRPYNPKPDGPRPDPWEYRPYGNNLGSRPYRY